MIYNPDTALCITGNVTRRLFFEVGRRDGEREYGTLIVDPKLLTD